MDRTGCLRATWLFVACSFFLLPCVWAAPYRPAGDSFVLETLRSGPVDARTRELRALRTAHEKDPANGDLAVRLAIALIERNRQTSDPRFLSYAEAALSRWTGSTSAPVNILVVRATIHQSLHRFQSALQDLARALEREPANVQAWLTRASILQVVGDYDEARRSLASLTSLAPGLMTVASAANLASLTGRGVEARHALEQALARNPRSPVTQRAWAMTALAEIAVRLGDNKYAEKHFRAALTLSPHDSYTLAAYADFLLDHQRPAEVISLLQHYPRIDSLLLRLAMAEKKLGTPSLDQHVATLRARFEASAQRGDTVHQREEAIFALKLLNEPVRAFRLAEANWRVQKEPADARILLESALATGKMDLLQSAKADIEKQGIADVRLNSSPASFHSIPHDP